VTYAALKWDITLPPCEDVRHDSLQETPFHRTSREITVFREAFQENYHESNTGNPNLQFHSINISFGIIFKAVWGTIDSTITRTYAGRSGDQNVA